MERSCTKQDMNHYRILIDKKAFQEFIDLLPELNPDEVYFLSLFARHKYAPEVPNLRDNQLARFAVTSKDQLEEYILRMECSFGGYKRGGTDIPREALAVYISPNPRNLVKANKELLVELATAFTEGRANFNPLTLARTAIHRAVSRKIFADFDYDFQDYQTRIAKIKEILPDNAFKILKTRGGFHLLVILANAPKTDWFKQLSALEGCDVTGSNTLLPVAGCVQGDFVPFLI